ncbi:MAG: hypothetical protein R2741_03290 [Methanolobus sp.]
MAEKSAFGFGILVLIIFILVLAWYFPFPEAGMTENVKIINLQWTDSVPINETHTRGNLSFDLMYVDKEHPRGLEKTLPVEIHISSRSTLYEDYELAYKGSYTGIYGRRPLQSRVLFLKGKAGDTCRLYAESFLITHTSILGDSRIEDLGMGKS